jgi:hypothetical protein
MTIIYLVINPAPEESNYSAIIKLASGKRLHGMGETPDQAIENVCELHENENS